LTSFTVVAAASEAQTAERKIKPTPATAAKTAAPPRTANGRPDLQGVWNFATITPLERPVELEDKPVLSDREAATQEQEAAKRNVDRPPRAGDPGAYNRFWLDVGTTVVWTKRTSLITDPPDGRIPPLTEEAKKREAARVAAFDRSENPEDRDLSERCILGFNAGPPMVPSAYNNYMQVFQTPDYVVILNEMVHSARIIPLDGRPHLRSGVRQWSGDSRGRWEGETLVVETINFSEKTHGAPVGAHRGYAANLHLIERFTRPNPDRLLYEFTINSPDVYARPWSAQVPMTRTDEPLYEYACHEGNYGLRGILAGARAQEKREP
jgi:hypothetical protein